MCLIAIDARELPFDNPQLVSLAPSTDVPFRFITCISSLMLESDLSELFKDVFSQHFLPILARLAKDPVTNVRMAVARLVRALVSTCEFLNVLCSFLFPSSLISSYKSWFIQISSSSTCSFRCHLQSP